MAAAVISIFSVPIFSSALLSGAYIADNKSHYRHPKTGVIEDSGGENSYALGQSMTESAVYGKALVEVDGDGSIFVTVRLQMQDNCKDASFIVDGVSVNADLIKEDNIKHTADWRIKVPSNDSVIRASMYVIPMGRSVIWYMTISNFKEGSGDFEVSIKTPEKKKAPNDELPVEHNIASQNPAEEQHGNYSETSKENNNDSEEQNSAMPEMSSSEHKNIKESNSEKAEAETIKGIEEFNQSGVKVADKTKGKKKISKKAVITVILFIVIVGTGTGITVAVLKKKEII